MPMFSVIIPVYNVEKYLPKCLDSVINQTYKDIEIMCVNDGSTDNSLNILKEYALKDNRIKIVNKENGGLASARNKGMEAATGEYISFIDSDDWIDKNTYEVLQKYINNTDMLFFGTYLEGSCKYANHKNDLKYYSVKLKGRYNLNDKILFKSDVSAWNKLYKLSIIKENNLFFDEGKHFEDYGFFWKYSLCAKNAYFIKDKFYHYLRRNDSIMAKTFARQSDKAIDHLAMAEIIFDFMKEKNIFDKNKNTANNIFINCLDFALAYSKQENLDDVYKYAKSIALKYNLDNKYKKIKALKYDNYSIVIEPELTFLQKIFSIRNLSENKNTKSKMVTILGMKFKIRK